MCYFFVITWESGASIGVSVIEGCSQVLQPMVCHLLNYCILDRDIVLKNVRNARLKARLEAKRLLIELEAPPLW